jgi:hypothetical protein
MLQILAVALLAVPSRIHAMTLLAVGFARQHSHLVVVRLVSVFVAVPVGFRLFGMPGAIWGVVASYLALVPAAMAYARRTQTLDFGKELAVLAAVVPGAAVGMVLTMTFGR